MTRIDAATLHNVIRYTLQEEGVPDNHARMAADALIETSLRGVDTHGIKLLEIYLRELNEGRSNPKPVFRYTRELAAITVMHADHALGVVSSTFAMKHAIKIAQEQGIGAVSVTHSNHFGAAGHYAALAAQNGQIGFACSHSDALVAAYNGVEPLTGTNPLALAAPGVGDELFLLDMATSQVSYSRVIQQLMAKKPLDSGWAIDEKGVDAKRNRRVHALEPLGGYKGQGLGMMVQILSAVLTGMPTDNTISPTYREPFNTRRNIGHFFMCLAPSKLDDEPGFRERISVLMQVFRNTPSRSDEPVISPGDREAEARKDRLVNGVPLDRREYEFFSPLLDKYGAPSTREYTVNRSQLDTSRGFDA